ncbi:mCG147127 [Mus musculus]|nr:mCG147127 [Mus musculus]
MAWWVNGLAAKANGMGLTPQHAQWKKKTDSSTCPLTLTRSSKYTHSHTVVTHILLNVYLVNPHHNESSLISQ